MSAPKHTPGPWKIGAYESGQMAVDGANGEEVTGFVDPEDARLIAAAPELLDALLAMQAFIEGEPNAVEPFGLIRAALAKATGGAS
jgi:hypothetical protein